MIGHSFETVKKECAIHASIMRRIIRFKATQTNIAEHMDTGHITSEFETANTELNRLFRVTTHPDDGHFVNYKIEVFREFSKEWDIFDVGEMYFN